MSAHLEKIAIVGAGIGGLTAALALVRRGLDVEVYEQAHELREFGQVSRSAPTAPGYFTSSDLKRHCYRSRCSRPAKWSGYGTPGKASSCSMSAWSWSSATVRLTSPFIAATCMAFSPRPFSGKNRALFVSGISWCSFRKWRGRRARIRRGCAGHGRSRHRRRWCALSRAREFVRRRSTAISAALSPGAASCRWRACRRRLQRMSARNGSVPAAMPCIIRCAPESF